MSDQEMDQYAETLSRAQVRAKAENAELITAFRRVQRRHRLVGLLVASAGLLFFMAALVALAYQGIRIAPLAALWTPWPPDWAKELLGLLAGAALIGLAWMVHSTHRARPQA